MPLDLFCFFFPLGKTQCQLFPPQYTNTSMHNSINFWKKQQKKGHKLREHLSSLLCFLMLWLDTATKLKIGLLSSSPYSTLRLLSPLPSYLDDNMKAALFRQNGATHKLLPMNCSLKLKATKDDPAVKTFKFAVRYRDGSSEAFYEPTPRSSCFLSGYQPCALLLGWAHARPLGLSWVARGLTRCGVADQVTGFPRAAAKARRLCWCGW